MEVVTRYRCEHCGELLRSEEECLKHEERHFMINEANKMLKNNATLEEINRKTGIWEYGVPEYLKEVTTQNCFKVEHWQCCKEPAYKVDYIDFNGSVRLWGCGSWSGYYGEFVNLSYRHLKDPRPKEELFIDKRYGTL